MTDKLYNFKMAFWLITNISIICFITFFFSFWIAIAVGVLIYLQFINSLDEWHEANIDYWLTCRQLRVPERVVYMKEMRQRSWFA